MLKINEKSSQNPGGLFFRLFNGLQAELERGMVKTKKGSRVA